MTDSNPYLEDPLDAADADNPYSSSPSPLALPPRNYVTLCDEPLNPWFSIWTCPRATIRQIIQRDPKRLVLFLVAVLYLKCVGEVHEFSAWKALGASLLALLVLGGTVLGIGLIIASVYNGLDAV